MLDFMMYEFANKLTNGGVIPLGCLILARIVSAETKLLNGPREFTPRVTVEDLQYHFRGRVCIAVVNSSDQAFSEFSHLFVFGFPPHAHFHV